MAARSTLDEKRVAFLETLDERTQRLNEGLDDLRGEHKADRVILTDIQGKLERMQGEGLAVKLEKIETLTLEQYEKLETRCFGDHDNSLDSRIRSQENFMFKVIGISIGAGAFSGVIVALIVTFISKRF